MVSSLNIPVRNRYHINTSEIKSDNSPLTSDDYMNIGYMSGRFGINPANPNEQNPIYKDGSEIYININSCCAPLFESTLSQTGIKFDKLA
ncbi:MAG: hypothetical protein LUB59_01515 [Candidatus Gastranaerophilales bacterium]|nr:hypothetical protein [Candidatus Gastranaerophilales bacterium]